MTAQRPVLDIVLARRDVPAGGMSRTFSADEAQRDLLARRYGLEAVRSLSGHFSVRPWRREGLAVTGHLSAEVVQRCVVTLEPVENTIDEEVDIRFDPEPDAAPADAEDDPPEPMEDGRADIGRILEEFFALGIDPYPRRPDAVFEAVDAGHGDGEAADERPFDALSALRNRPKDR